MNQKTQVFLSAEWQNLVMLNYEVDGKLLRDFVPPGTVLDSFHGKTYISLVGFQFRHTKLFGSLGIPFHADFDEVNLRFYVRRKEDHEERRGVVFIAEIVPKWMVARIARLAYGENYICLPMKHQISADGAGKTAEYAWQRDGAWSKLYAHASVAPKPAQNGSLEQFITEHYWGYSVKGNDSLEYHVSHVPWKLWSSATAGLEGDVRDLYGPELGKVLQYRPDFAFIAEGSPVVVFAGRKIR
jgi:uncharacterized protein